MNKQMGGSYLLIKHNTFSSSKIGHEMGEWRANRAQRHACTARAASGGSIPRRPRMPSVRRRHEESLLTIGGCQAEWLVTTATQPLKHWNGLKRLNQGPRIFSGGLFEEPSRGLRKASWLIRFIQARFLVGISYFSGSRQNRDYSGTFGDR